MPMAGGQNIAAYLPVGGEIDPRPLMQALRRQGSGICLPVCGDGEAAMIFRRYRDGDALLPDEMGIAAPRPTRPSARPILFCCRFWRLTARAIGSDAAVAFTTAHWPHCAHAALRFIGLAFDMQMVDKCPIAPHDEVLARRRNADAMV